MVYDGGCAPAVFQCANCPYRLYGEVDEISQQAQAIWNLVCQPLVPDQPPALEFFFKLINIEVGSERSREVYIRMLELSRIMWEHQELTKGEPPTPEAQEQED